MFFFMKKHVFYNFRQVTNSTNCEYEAQRPANERFRVFADFEKTNLLVLKSQFFRWFSPTWKNNILQKNVLSKPEAIFIISKTLKMMFHFQKHFFVFPQNKTSLKPISRSLRVMRVFFHENTKCQDPFPPSHWHEAIFLKNILKCKMCKSQNVTMFANRTFTFDAFWNLCFYKIYCEKSFGSIGGRKAVSENHWEKTWKKHLC